MVPKLLLIFILNILCTIAAPLVDAKDIWSRNIFAPVIKTACSSDGKCWGWLLKSETYNGTVIVPEQDSDALRLESRRQIANPLSEFMLRSWKDSVPEAGREIRAPINKQTRITKKDVFVSRDWGAGGMPFSVLYMNPRSNHAVTATSTSQRQESGMTTETSFLEHPNSRIAPRNGQSAQPRRQYWTIPQLFISYGWGPFGK